MIYLNEADDATSMSADYEKSLEDSIKQKQERLKEIEEEKKQRIETDKKLELETKESQKYNLGQIQQKKAAYTVTKDVNEQKRLKLELDRLEKERKRIADQLENIKKSKEEFDKSKIEEIKRIQDEIKQDQNMIKNTSELSKQSSNLEENMDEDDYLDKYGFVIRRKFARMEEQELKEPKKKILIVNFDKSTPNPFQVKFTERGFLIGETRLSFELLEVAISKQLNLVLDSGKGMVLDAIKMQKILKYKDRV